MSRTAIIPWPSYAEVSADRAWERHRLDVVRGVTALLSFNYRALATDAGVWVFGDDSPPWTLDAILVRLTDAGFTATETTTR